MSANEGGSPPKVWERHGPSPNPKGRPRKTQLSTILPGKLYALAAEFLDFDRRSSGLQDASGNDLTFGKAFLQSLYKRSLKDNRAAALYAVLREAAYKQETELRMKLIEEVNYHKYRYLDAFRQAEAMGRPVPSILPDPRYIEVMPDGDVRFETPVDHAEQNQLERVLRMRDMLLEALESIVVDDPSRRDDLASVYLHLRRRIYKLHPLIPKRLRKRIPPLRDVTRGS